MTDNRSTDQNNNNNNNNNSSTKNVADNSEVKSESYENQITESMHSGKNERKRRL